MKGGRRARAIERRAWHTSGTSENRGRADPLLSIGVFVRRSRLSMKALRLYDHVGLLKPVQIDLGIADIARVSSRPRAGW